MTEHLAYRRARGAGVGVETYKRPDRTRRRHLHRRGLHGFALYAATQTTLWCIVFFFASAAASAGYLTVSEIFPMEIRAMAIALFYSIATAIGGISGPVLFGNIIGTGNAASLFVAYLVGAGFMIFAAVVELILGVRAEGKSLENIATPLTAIEEAAGTSAASSAT
jgi:MFS family permease